MKSLFNSRIGAFFLEAANRSRYQFLFAFILAIILPLLIRVSQPTAIGVSGLINTTVICTLTLFASFRIWQQLNRLPSVTGLLYVFWSFIPVYALSLFIITMARIDYNRFVLLASFIIAIIWFIMLQFLQGRFAPMRFLIIPGGKVGRVTDIKRPRWIELEKPPGFPISSSEVPALLESEQDSKIHDDVYFSPASGRNGIVADLRHNHSEDWERFMAASTLAGMPVYHYKQLEEKLTGKVSIDHLSENSFGSVLPDVSYLKVKQLLDLMVTLLAMPVLLPVMLVIACLIKFREGGPVLFKQTRMGYRGKPFTAFKFRTMRVSDPQEKRDGEDISWAMTGENDPRITQLGQFLRKSRLDELPQAINIMRGEMSWIGPRPEVSELSDHYAGQIPFYAYRYAVRPGISGWAQVHQGHVTSVDDISEKLKLDFFYIKNVSILLDFIIVLKTIRTMVNGVGAR